MAKCRFVQPDLVRLTLSDGDWVDVKRRLSVGEERAAFQQIVGEVNQDGWRRPNLEMMGIAEMAAYVTGWSFRDPQDRPVPVSVAALKQLDGASFKELEAALEAHVTTQDEDEAARKNGQAGANASVPTSPSAG
jgi:hypothetical protein